MMLRLRVDGVLAHRSPLAVDGYAHPTAIPSGFTPSRSTHTRPW